MPAHRNSSDLRFVTAYPRDTTPGDSFGNMVPENREFQEEDTWEGALKAHREVGEDEHVV